MGSCAFTTTARGATAEEAFREAVESAQFEHGHGGCTGTIAEKDEVTPITHRAMPEGDAQKYAKQLLDTDDPRVDDKWGPAGAIPLDDGCWLLFGWAPS